jgi:histidine ammonia-lyase
MSAASADPATPDSGIILAGQPLTIDDVVAVARHRRTVAIAPAVAELLAQRRAHITDHVAAGRTVYGVSTGLGSLATVRVDTQELGELQRNVLRSHAAATGEPLADEVVRAMMLLRARTLTAGYSGVRSDVVELLAACLNAGVHPVVPSRGSVGASGDLAQLAHIGLGLIGEGWARTPHGERAAADALAEAGLAPLQPQTKEGLALVNGTEGMVALGVLAAHDTRWLLATADVTAAMTTEAGLGSDRPFAADLQQLRGHPGQMASAANLRRLLAASPIVASHRDSDHAVQDPYSVRCAPQVHGAARDGHAFCAQVLDRELAAVTDNPVLLANGDMASGGNFHGEPLGMAFSALAVGLASLANISERRTLWLISPESQRELPAFLAARPGLESGLMLAQYTQAALVAEIKQLAQAPVLDSIPTSGMQEDHVSMAWLAGLRLRDLAGKVATVLGVEAVCAARALDLRAPLAAAAGTAAARAALRRRVAPLDSDRPLGPDLEAAAEAVMAGELTRASAKATGGTELA